jgi:hypothetical protein
VTTAEALAAITSAHLDVADVEFHAAGVTPLFFGSFAAVICLGAIVATGRFVFVARIRQTRRSWALAALAATLTAVLAPVSIVAISASESQEQAFDDNRAAAVERVYPGVDMSEDDRLCIYRLAGASNNRCRVSFLSGNEVVELKFRRVGKQIIATQGPTEKVYGS